MSIGGSSRYSLALSSGWLMWVGGRLLRFKTIGLKPFFPGHVRTEAILLQCSESFDCISTDLSHYYYFVGSVSISILKLLLHGTTSPFSLSKVDWSGFSPVPFICFQIYVNNCLDEPDKIGCARMTYIPSASSRLLDTRLCASYLGVLHVIEADKWYILPLKMVIIWRGGCILLKV